jgi:hypothetical protein
MWGKMYPIPFYNELVPSVLRRLAELDLAPSVDICVRGNWYLGVRLRSCRLVFSLNEKNTCAHVSFDAYNPYQVFVWKRGIGIHDNGFIQAVRLNEESLLILGRPWQDDASLPTLADKVKMEVERIRNRASVDWTKPFVPASS